MRLVRFRHASGPRWGMVEGETVYLVEGSVYAQPTRGAAVGRLADLALLAPAEPSKVACYAGNYYSLMTAPGRPPIDFSTFEPMIFLKSGTCAVGPNADVLLPRVVEGMYPEPELSFVIRREAYKVREADAADYILGYTAGNDYTCANVHNRDNHLARSKSFETWAPCGPMVVTDLDTRDLAIRCWINGRQTVDQRTSDLIWNCHKVLAEMSYVMRLLPGDLVMTGVPKYEKVYLAAGDLVEMEIEGIGRIVNRIVVETD